ncbi:hypothetical protein HanXRQr2_Chr09g0386971 [Helianthus annuus]|uniref:Uncharacterized protein n=1 Tax=Helianthus annuus TaxID=4232 RepID=A0A9K3N867_HELAN|nr:hypothetical protein HanXRQr2_Chr09g0386971 [Helianthus annuus]KAJ0893031.1 hypothetical protein HanPSC8_Chr09g0372971 [Helianthus annuus]
MSHIINLTNEMGKYEILSTLNTCIFDVDLFCWVNKILGKFMKLPPFSFIIKFQMVLLYIS